MGNPTLILTAEQAQQTLLEFARLIPRLPEDRILNIDEAAKFLGISKDLLYRKSSSGAIPCRNIGTDLKAKYIFSQNALSEWARGEQE